jgi:putative hydrolase of the HAD superfamily
MKVLLLDADGLVIKPRHTYFSEKFSEEFSVPLEEVLPFFKQEYKNAAMGKSDIVDLLPPYLKKWNWDKGVDEFLKYWFESEKDIDPEVLNKIKQLRSKGVKVYLVSDNEKRRAEYLMNEVGLEKEFDGAFFSCKLGVTKSSPEFFKKIIDKLKTTTSEISYFDDDEKNVDIAKSQGIDAEIYPSVKFLKI